MSLKTSQKILSNPALITFIEFTQLLLNASIMLAGCDFREFWQNWGVLSHPFINGLNNFIAMLCWITGGLPCLRLPKKLVLGENRPFFDSKLTIFDQKLTIFIQKQKLQKTCAWKVLLNSATGMVATPTAIQCLQPSFQFSPMEFSLLVPFMHSTKRKLLKIRYFYQK